LFGEREQQPAERGGDGYVVLAEADGDLVAVAGDLADGERGDTARGLAVEQDQAPGGPVDGLESVVVQEPGCQFPAAVAGDRGPVPPLRAGDIEAGAVPAASSRSTAGLVTTASTAAATAAAGSDPSAVIT
jgi:Tfp pilus assembly protein PilW